MSSAFYVSEGAGSFQPSSPGPRDPGSLHAGSPSERVCLDAITIPEPTGVGIAVAALLDERGAIGRAVQTLLVRRREAG